MFPKSFLFITLTVIFLLIQGAAGFFVKHVQTGMCINDTSIIHSQGSSWGNRSFVELSNNCLDPAAQFRFRDNGAMLNLKRQGCLATFYTSGSGYYLDMFYIYVDAFSLDRSACAQKPGERIYRAITQTTWGGLSVYYKGYRKSSFQTWCAVNGHYEKLAENPGIDPYVKLTTSCTDTLEKRFHFGSVTCYGNMIKNANCPKDQYMVVKTASYRGLSGTKTCGLSDDYSCEVNVTCLVKKKCDGQHECNITVDDKLFPANSCRGFTRYLYFEYQCADDAQRFTDTCILDVSLSNSSLPNEGFVQIITDSGKKNVCGKSLSNNAKNVVCGQLGYKNKGSLFEKAVPPNNKDAVFSGTIDCNGGEKNLSQCPITTSKNSCSELSYIKCTVCSRHLLKDEQTFPDSSFTASVSSEGHSASDGRISSGSSWCAPVSNDKYYLEVDLGRLYVIDTFVTFGDSTGLKWVTSYSLNYTVDLINWRPILNHNIPGNTKATNHAAIQQLSEGKTIRALRFIPLSFVGQPCMRIEICGGTLLPDKPSNIMVTHITSRSVNVTWQDPENDGESREGLTGVWIKLKKDNSLILNITTIKVNTYEINSILIPHTTYEISIAVGNKDGFGEGNISSFTTSEEARTTTSPKTTKSVKRELEKELEELNSENISDKRRREVAQNVINKLVDLTNLDEMNQNERENGLEQQTLNDTVQILENIVHLNISDNSIDVLAPANNIFDARNKKSWRKMKSDKIIRNLMTTLESYGFQYGENLKNNSNGQRTFQNYSNIKLHVSQLEADSVSTPKEKSFIFPDASFNITPNALHLQSGAILVVIWFKTIHSFFTNTIDSDEIRSKIITASIRPEPTEKFSQPIRLSWNIQNLNDSATCVFLKPETNQRKWKSDGCFRVKNKQDSNHLICECDHLTAFAVMDISKDMVSRAERRALELISTIGCSVSLLGIILTILAHALLRKKLQHNDKTKVLSQVLMHLCGAIGMTDILAILAGPAQNNLNLCTAVSILLYFFVLAVFGWMLCEGIIIYLQLVNVYTGLGLGNRHLKVFYVIGWGVPVLVVSVLVGFNDRKDFITEHACWCRGDGVLFWTFVGTISLILVINLVIFILALRSALSSSKVKTTRTLEETKNDSTKTKATVDTALRKAKMALKGSAILFPLLGLTWIFGLLVFNRETIVFKYLFAICNSLQGMMIFVFHVLINKKVHDAISKEKKARKDRQILNNTTINNTCGTLSSGEGSSRKISIPIGHGFSKRNFNGTKSLIEIENNDVILRNKKGGSQSITLHE